MEQFNHRDLAKPESARRRVSILVEFPDVRFEAIVVQWEHARPTVLIQLKLDPKEPLQFPGLRPHVPGNADLPKEQTPALELPLRDFVDPCAGQPYEGMAYDADIVISRRAFNLLQPEPDLVLPVEAMSECRTEALVAVRVADEAGIAAPVAAH